jgi:hypothetical protein
VTLTQRNEAAKGYAFEKIHVLITTRSAQCQANTVSSENHFIEDGTSIKNYFTPNNRERSRYPRNDWPKCMNRNHHRRPQAVLAASA